MNQIGFSNICNLLAQQIGFLGYHRGYESDMNRNVDNNANPQNKMGNRYPYVLLEPIPSTIQFSNCLRGVHDIRLNFYDLQYRNNQGQTLTDTTLEQTQSLLDKAKAFVYLLSSLGKMYQYGIGIETQTVQFETMEMQHNDRLIQVVATFRATWNEECPTETFNPALIPTSYEWPVSLEVDYETLKPLT